MKTWLVLNEDMALDYVQSFYAGLIKVFLSVILAIYA